MKCDKRTNNGSENGKFQGSSYPWQESRRSRTGAFGKSGESIQTTARRRLNAEPPVGRSVAGSPVAGASLSLFAFPRRLRDPASGRSPDSRIFGPAAFPSRKAGQWRVAGPPRLQWRGRAGFSPASRLSAIAPEAKINDGAPRGALHEGCHLPCHCTLVTCRELGSQACLKCNLLPAESHMDLKINRNLI
jgi:hypothetical protein